MYMRWKLLIINQPFVKQFLKTKKVVKVKCKIFGPLDVSALLRRRLVIFFRFFMSSFLIIFSIYISGRLWLDYLRYRYGLKVQATLPRKSKKSVQFFYDNPKKKLVF